jgi:hypothetical protein
MKNNIKTFIPAVLSKLAISSGVGEDVRPGLGLVQDQQVLSDHKTVPLQVQVQTLGFLFQIEITPSMECAGWSCRIGGARPRPRPGSAGLGEALVLAFSPAQP